MLLGKESLHKLFHHLRWSFFKFISLSCSSNLWNSYIHCFSNLVFLYRCHFKRHHGMACILIATTAINSLRVISRWGTDLFPLETQRGPSGRRKKWEGKERKGRKGKGRKKGERAPFILAQFPFPSPPLPFCRLPFRSGKRQPILGILYCLSSDGQLLTVISLLQY